MIKQWITNRDQVGTTEARNIVLDIVEAGLDAIDTDTVVRASVSIDGSNLKIKQHVFDLTHYEHLYIVGFGKASCVASAALSSVLGSTIDSGIAIGLAPVTCEYIGTYGGTHPLPSVRNVELSQKIVDLSGTVTEKDLVLVVVSGGGSSLLCWPMTECEQAQRLYQAFLKTGGDIKELNTVRKHISSLKGGGLAKLLYPATVVGLIFSDIPGDSFEHTASAPTYLDTTTVADAQAIIDRYQLGTFELTETPKDSKYFERVTNIPLVSNLEVLSAMENKAVELGLRTHVLSAELYEDTETVAKLFTAAAKPGTVVLGAGEPKVVVTAEGGTGGRCQRLGIDMLPLLTLTDVFAAVASDGLDNGTAAGVIEDSSTVTGLTTNHLDLEDYRKRFDSQTLYERLGHELLMTGPTHANVSDFMVLYRPS